METVAERAEAILDKIAQNRLNSSPLEVKDADDSADDGLVERQ